jgi:hypothetical protein
LNPRDFFPLLFRFARLEVRRLRTGSLCSGGVGISRVLLSLLVSARSPLLFVLARVVLGDRQRFSIPASAFSRFGTD